MEYLVKDDELSSVADAIRAKGGTTEPLSFPGGFVSAVEKMSTGGNTDGEDGIIMRTLSGAYENSRVTTIGNSAFIACYSLATVSFPMCTTIGGHAFAYCSSLTTVSFPVCATIGSDAFGACYSLATVSFPMCTSIGNSAFYNCVRLPTVSFPVCATIGSDAFAACRNLTTVSFPACTSIESYAFRNCYRLVSFYLLGSLICSLAGSTAFNSTPIGGYSAFVAGRYGSIYVPASLLASYKVATNWTYFSSRFVGV